MRDYDARIVDLYDGDNPAGDDHAFYLALANRTGARSILDVGCGTGLLTVSFTGHDRRVVGVDPSHTMISYARNRPGAEGVTWIEGDIRAVPEGDFDLVVMTGNVAQHIPDPEWERTLVEIRSRARYSAMLAFESRNPQNREWESWDQPEPTERDTIHGRLREWYEVKELDGGQVLLLAHNRFVDSGEYVLQQDVLTFRDHTIISNQLLRAGFEVAAIWGDWHQSPFDGTGPVMVFEARAV